MMRINKIHRLHFAFALVLMSTGCHGAGERKRQIEQFDESIAMGCAERFVDLSKKFRELKCQKWICVLVDGSAGLDFYNDKLSNASASTYYKSEDGRNVIVNVDGMSGEERVSVSFTIEGDSCEVEVAKVVD